MKKFLGGFDVFELIIIAMMSALGIATKPIITPLVHMITGPLYIPGGALAGGFYMMWIVIGAGLVKKRGTATLVAMIQGIIVIVTGTHGTHGIMSVVTYTLPGLMVDVLLLIMRKRGDGMLECFLAGVVANMTGTYLSNLVFFNLPLVPLILSLSSSALSGSLGGIIAYNIINKLKGLNLINSDL